MDTYVHLSLFMNYGNSHTGCFLGQSKTPKNIKRQPIIKLYSRYAFFHSHHLSYNISITYLILKLRLLVVSHASPTVGFLAPLCIDQNSPGPLAA